MQRVPLDLVQPGMVLAKPVTNDSGMALCAEGTELSANIIDRLKRMNISFVTLKGNPVDLGGEVKTREEKVREIIARFSKVDSDPIMDKVKDSIVHAVMSEEEDETDDDEAGPKEESPDE